MGYYPNTILANKLARTSLRSLTDHILFSNPKQSLNVPYTKKPFSRDAFISTHTAFTVPPRKTYYQP